MHSGLQKKVIELVNSGVSITHSVIKETLRHGKVYKLSIEQVPSMSLRNNKK